MNKKLVFTLLMLCIAVVSISTASAFWPFDSGTDITVNGVQLHMLEGFDDVRQDTININTNYEAYTYHNPESHDFISIAVYDNPNSEANTVNNLIDSYYEKINIKGKDVYYKILLNSRYNYVYLENGKYVSIEVPIVYDDGRNVLDSKEMANEIIK